MQRLYAAAPSQRLPAKELEGWSEAFQFIQLLRLRLQHEGSAGNRLDPDTLNPLDRRILKESFRQARKLQTRLAMDYRL